MLIFEKLAFFDICNSNCIAVLEFKGVHLHVYIFERIKTLKTHFTAVILNINANIMYLPVLSTPTQFNLNKITF